MTDEEVAMTEIDRPPEATARWTTAPLPDGTLPFNPQSVPTLAPKWSAPLADAPAGGVWKNFDQIKISCTMTMCDADLHCFRLTKKLSKTLSPGSCRECSQLLVSLQRTADRNLDDIDATFAALQKECIRHYFWHVPFGQKALDYATRAGRRELEARVERRIHSRIGTKEPYNDGRQTPTAHDRADAIDFALHAVAACCRKCANYWHGIPLGLPLSDTEINYLSELARRYLQARLPGLSNEPHQVPRRSHRAAVHTLGNRTTHTNRVASQPHAS
jgi:hypothetical protein